MFGAPPIVLRAPGGLERLSKGRHKEMRILSYVVLCGVIAVFVGGLVLPNLSVAEDAKEEAPVYKYVGTKGCKMCHSKEKNGLIHEGWLESAHAKTFEKLSAEQQKDAKCLGCHTTGHGKALAANVKPEDMQGVQCEACHGPGSEYKKMKVMKDHEASMANGLIEANEKVCASCHTAELPKECWGGADAAPKFVFAEAYKLVEHHVPEKK